MKKQSRLTALLLALCMLMSTLPVSALADGILTLEDYLSAVQRVQQELSEPSIPVEEENAYTLTRTTTTETIVRETLTDELSGEGESDFTLPVAGKLELSTAAAADAYQWQIDVGGVWANIVGDTAAAVTLTYAKVQNALSGGKARVRCAMTQDGQTVYSAVATVTVDETVKTQTVEGTEEISAVSYTSEAPRSLARTLNAGVGTYANDTGDTSGSSGSSTTMFYVYIEYRFAADNSIAAETYTAELSKGSSINQTVPVPEIQGYLAYDAIGDEANKVTETVLNFDNIDASHTITVYYKPTDVNYKVKHYQQNVDDDGYSLVETEDRVGLTASTVPDVAKTYDGFYALLYEKPEIAADGSTGVEVYYDRYYYLMNFDLDGGYGVEPIYARYGAPIGDVGTPTKAGYTFSEWTLNGSPVTELPATMPAENTSYKASWKIGESGFTVVFWYENANDDGYSVAGTYTPADVAPGTQKKSEDYKNQSFTGRDDKHFTYNAAKAETVTVKGDGSTVLNVYFTRNTYTLTFKDGNIKIVCGKVEHEHSHEQCCTKTGLHRNCNSKKCPVGYEHEHTTGGWGTPSCYETSDLTITTKYQADIHENFPIKDGNDTIWWDVPDRCESFKPGTMLGSIDTMPGEHITFTKAGTQSGAVLYYYIETLNGETGTYTHDGKSFKLYKQITLDKYCQLTYSEEFHPIMGFTQWWSDPKFDKMEQGGVAYEDIDRYGYYYIKDENYLCYTRNSYNLKFYNYNAYVDDKGGSVQYEAPLSSYYFEPEYPANLEKNAYVFDGWYTTAGCYEGSKADLSTMTMPANDLMLYAHWVPKVFEVKFYQDEASTTDKEPVNTFPDVPFNTVLGEAYTEDDLPNVKSQYQTGKYEKYDFVGWFYRDANGVEKAFSIDATPVKGNLNIYAKWSSNTIMKGILYYKSKDESGNPIEIAKPRVVSALAGNSKTYDAKGDTELYQGYQEGYFPVTKSHNMLFKIETGEPDGENWTTIKNENGEEEVVQCYTFWYVQKPAVPYTVYYVTAEEVEGAKTVVLNGTTYYEVAATKTVSDNKKAVVTEVFQPVAGYMPDAYQKPLVVSVDENGDPDTDGNVIIFYYTKDESHAYYSVTRYTEALTTDGNGEPEWNVYSYSYIQGNVNDKVTAEIIGIEGYTYDSTISTASGTLESGKILELKLYYRRNRTTLTVTKTGLTDENESAIFTLTKKDDTTVIARFSLKNGQSVTIDGLTVGETYTVTEESGWTWHYEGLGSETVTIQAPREITFKNKPKPDKWLYAESSKHNVFQGEVSSDE